MAEDPDVLSQLSQHTVVMVTLVRAALAAVFALGLSIAPLAAEAQQPALPCCYERMR